MAVGKNKRLSRERKLKEERNQLILIPAKIGTM